MKIFEKIRDAFRRAPLRAWGAAGLLLLIGAVLVYAGIPSKPTVAGIVRLDGQPMLTGRINFIPLPGTAGPDAGATIEEGKYRVEKGLTVGEYRVEIQGTRQTNKKVQPPFPGDPVWDEVPNVAAEYNEKSKLTHRVHAGANTRDFEVEGIKGKGSKTRK
jgi:hypothetical protein